MAFWKSNKIPSDRPVVVLGAGVLGRRIACIWASGGYDVVIYDPSSCQRTEALEYAQNNILHYTEKTHRPSGQIQAIDCMTKAVQNAWLVVECVPEKLQAKIEVFADLERLTQPDTILATNSSSYRSSEMLERVGESTKARVLNTHYYMPPACMIVELMTSGSTDPEIITFLVERSREVGTVPYVARRESTGFIFNRLWAAVKREVLTILAEGVSEPGEIDSMWSEMFVKGASLPCTMMDAVGLDTVANIEKHYIAERGLSSAKTTDFLDREYLQLGKLGNKSNKGGLYPPSAQPTDTREGTASPSNNGSSASRIFALDVGLSAPEWNSDSGAVVEITRDGVARIVVDKQSMPDGLVVDRKSQRMFWTCMGVPGKDDGAVWSANIDGADCKIIVPPGAVNTPKQLANDSVNEQLYFCDREGTAVFRCRYDGSSLQRILTGVQASSNHVKELAWCVGVAPVPSVGKLFWSQKGPSKGGKGRIFCADLPSLNEDKVDVASIQCLLDNLPEPIDLEYSDESQELFWTDRGELPFGNSLNSMKLNERGERALVRDSAGHEVIARNFHEAIGLKLVPGSKEIFVTDLGGSVYTVDRRSGAKTAIFCDEHRAFTGISYI
ncbi:hypothetical protein Q7P37_010341 [Cladosporium fusiforme]